VGIEVRDLKVELTERPIDVLAHVTECLCFHSEEEGTPLPVLAYESDFPLELLYKLLADGETQSHSLRFVSHSLGLIDPLEHLE